jgi:hypothetical protein
MQPTNKKRDYFPENQCAIEVCGGHITLAPRILLSLFRYFTTLFFSSMIV